jgi:HK97 family phage major capsid protein
LWKDQPSATKTFRQVLKEAVEPFTDDIKKMSANDKTVKHISIPIDIKAVGDITVGNVTGGTVYGGLYRPGIVELPKRKVHMRNVLPGGNIGAGTDYYFMKQNGTGEGSIAFTAETGTKSQFDDDLVETSVKIETLAGWQRITRKAMNNVPGFMQFLNSRMVEKLLKAEDAGILYGDGVSPNIKGILTSGNFTASTSTATILVEKIIDDIATLEDTYERDANIIALRPQHYYGFFKNKAVGSGEYDFRKMY